MIEINVKTKEVRGHREHEPQVFSHHFGKMNITPGYIRGWCPPNYPVPAIRVNFGPPWLDYWWARTVVLFGPFGPQR